MFKAHFIAILAGVAPYFPRNLWDLLLPKTELTLNLLWQVTLKPSRSAWAYFHGSFNYDATPLGSLGCDIITHKNTGTRHLWDFRGAAGWNVGVAIQHYQYHTIVEKATQAAQVSDTLEFRHHNLTHPTVTPMDRIVHGMTTLTCALHDAPNIVCDNQLAAIHALHQDIQQWAKLTLSLQKKPHITTPPPTRTKHHSILRPMRRPKKYQPQDAPPRVVIQKSNPPPGTNKGTINQ